MNISNLINKQILKTKKSTYVERSDIRNDNILDCGWGVSQFGVSKNVVESAKTFEWKNLWQLPDPSYLSLKNKIATYWSSYASINPKNIRIANGSAFILDNINKLCLNKNSKVLGYAPQFGEYISQILLMGVKYNGVPLIFDENLKFDKDKFINKISPEYKLIYIDNPNNPTGQYIPLSIIEYIVKLAQKNNNIVLIDEAYGDFLHPEKSSINLFKKYKNIIITRTFTKAYGLASCRIGYAFIPTSVIKYYDMIALPFPTSSASSYFAIKALSDKKFILNCRDWVFKEKSKLVNKLSCGSFNICETHMSCPIFVMQHQNKNINLYEMLLKKDILTLPGHDFMFLDTNFVRVNLPRYSEDFLNRLSR